MRKLFKKGDLVRVIGGSILSSVGKKTPNPNFVWLGMNCLLFFFIDKYIFLSIRYTYA
jgi:hypothetical protein